MVKIRSPAVRALLSVTALIATSPVIADSSGSSLYQRAAKNEVNGYARVIELQHAGDMNGKFLAAWEHWYANSTTLEASSTNGTAGNFIIRESDKEGTDWTTLATVYDPQTSPGHPSPYFYQPFLFEFPQQLGKYPAGTILLVGNLCNGTNTQFFSWRFQNHGQTWDAVGACQGRLLAVFSDERNRTDNGQILAHLVSTDGGDTWDTYTPDVVSSRSKDRPGMATVAKMDNGEYFMSYEFCTEINANCTVHGKVSPDGINWNNSDVGNPIATIDGITLWASPYTVWDPFTKQLVLASMNQFLDYTTKDDAPEIRRSVFTNKDYGKGEWFWSPSPWAVPPGTGTNCTSNRSPNLLPLSNGVVRYTTQSPQDVGFCSEQTGKAPIGVLPYTANFSTDGQAGWIDLGGDWSVSGDQYSFAPTTNTSAVALTGSSGWTDYKISADVMISSKSGDIGLSTRVSALESGLNHLKKYTAVISSVTGNLTVYKVANASTPLHSWALPGGIEASKWYHLSFAVRSGNLTVTLTGSNISYTATDDTFARGMVGLYGNNGSGSFRNVQIMSLS